jgi:hypothetical protein
LHDSFGWVGFDSDITFDFGPSGSNSASEPLPSSSWQYIYIDKSAVDTLGSATLNASCLRNSQLPPEWVSNENGYYNTAQKGMYYGDDRLVFVVRIEGGEVVDFRHDGSDHVQWTDQIVHADFKGSTNWQDQSLSNSQPPVCDYAELLIERDDNGQEAYVHYGIKNIDTGVVAGQHELGSVMVDTQGNDDDPVSYLVAWTSYTNIGQQNVWKTVSLRVTNSQSAFQVRQTGFFLPKGL